MRNLDEYSKLYSEEGFEDIQVKYRRKMIMEDINKSNMFVHECRFIFCSLEELKNICTCSYGVLFFKQPF